MEHPGNGWTCGGTHPHIPPGPPRTENHSLKLENVSPKATSDMRLLGLPPPKGSRGAGTPLSGARRCEMSLHPPKCKAIDVENKSDSSGVCRVWGEPGGQGEGWGRGIGESGQGREGDTAFQPPQHPRHSPGSHLCELMAARGPRGQGCPQPTPLSTLGGWQGTNPPSPQPLSGLPH